MEAAIASDGQRDRELAASYARKKAAGDKPTKNETRGHARWERDREEALRWQYYATVPKIHFTKMADKQRKVLDGFAMRYGMPIRGKTVDVRAFIQWTCEFIATNGHKLNAFDSDDPMLAGASSPALERYRLARAKSEELNLQEREGSLLAKEDVHGLLGQLAGILRGCTETVRKQHGAEAAQVVNEGIDDFLALVQQWKAGGRQVETE